MASLNTMLFAKMLLRKQIETSFFSSAKLVKGLAPLEATALPARGRG